MTRYVYVLTASPGSPGRPGGPMSPTSPRNPASPRPPFAPVSPTSPGGPGSPGLPTLTAVIIIPNSASSPCLVLLIYTQYLFLMADRGSTVVKVLCYNSEGRWFDPSWCQWHFH